MGFLNPWVLAGLAAVSVPVAIHLLNKLRIQRTRWAAMRFVQESLRKNQRRLQIEDLLLLILRCLVVAALVIAFARPVFRTLVPGLFAGGDGPAATVVLLDNSASMGQSNGVSSRFEEGRKAIRDSLDQLPAGSPLALFLVSSRVDPLIAKPASDLPRFRRSLELAELSDRSTDLARGIRAAYDALKPLEGQRREIAVYTDSQMPAWKGLSDVQKLQQLNPGILLKPVILGAAGEDNLAVVGLRAEGGVPAAGQPCRFRVDVANYGAKAAEGVRVTISADDQPPSDETLLPRIEPGATQSVNLFVRFDGPGFHAVTARIPPDRLAVDNQRSTALQVVDRMEVLIVDGNGQTQAPERDGYFLANALAPVASDRTKKYYLNISSVPFAAMNRASFASYDTVFFCNPGTLSDQAVASLKTYVSDGGNLVIFPGSKTDPAAWKKNAVLSALLPATLGPRRTGVKPPVALQADGFNHPVTSIWNDRGEGALSAATYSEWFPLELKTGESRPAVILRLANNEPAAVEWAVGRGRVVLFNAPATPRGNNLVLHPGFVALTQRLMGYLNRGSAARLVLGPGDTFEMPVAMELLGKDFSIVRPGEDTNRRPAGRVELDDQRAVIRFRDTDAVGAYRIFIGQDTHPSAVFAVQMDPTESDLRQAPRSEIEALTQAPTDIPESSTVVAPRMQVKKEYWTVLIWLAALLALAEGALAHRMSASR
jgi:hypothetical protein